MRTKRATNCAIAPGNCSASLALPPRRIEIEHGSARRSAATEDGVPLGVQLIGRPGGEHVLLAIGAQLERRLKWDLRHPPQWDALR